MDNSGNLYGTTSAGGDLKCFSVTASSFGCGVVFKIAPDHTYSVLHAFRCGTDGGAPSASLSAGKHGELISTATYGGNGATCNLEGGNFGNGVVFKLRE